MKSPQSSGSSHSQQDQQQQQQQNGPQRPSSQYNEQYPMMGDQDRLMMQNMNVTPMTMLLFFTIMTVIFVAFIVIVVSLLTPNKNNNTIENVQISPQLTPPNVLQSEQYNNNSSTKHGQVKSIVEQQQKFLQLQQFISTNTGKQPLDLFFTKNVLANKNNIQFNTIQRQYYQKLYSTKLSHPDKQSQIGRQKQQISFCIVATGRNNMVAGRQKRFLQSVQRIQYNKFKLVYVDDHSEDTTVSFTKEFIANSAMLRNRAIVVQRQRRYYALSNKVKAIQEYCYQDIVVDVDSDDQFIGSTSLSILNHLYTLSPQVWFLYTNHLLQTKQSIQRGHNQGLSSSQWVNYRTSQQWITSHLKTYRRDLFMKIDISQWKGEDGQFYHWASDRFIMYSLIQLAGQQHTRFENIMLYLYDHGAQQDVRNFEVIKVDKMRSQMLTPYQNLASLQDELKKREGYQVPRQISEGFRRAQQKYQSLINRGSISN